METFSLMPRRNHPKPRKRKASDPRPTVDRPEPGQIDSQALAREANEARKPRPNDKYPVNDGV